MIERTSITASELGATTVECLAVSTASYLPGPAVADSLGLYWISKCLMRSSPNIAGDESSSATMQGEKCLAAFKGKWEEERLRVLKGGRIRSLQADCGRYPFGGES